MDSHKFGNRNRKKVNENMKQYYSNGEKIVVDFENEHLIINQNKIGSIIDIKITVYSSGEILYKTPRNFINIHLYDYIYEFLFVLQNGQKISVFSKYNKRFFSKILHFNKEKEHPKKKNYKLEFYQKKDLPLVVINNENDRQFLENVSLEVAAPYLKKCFPRVTFYKIPFDYNKDTAKETYSIYIFHKFAIQSATNLFTFVFVCTFIIGFFVSLYVTEFKYSLNNLLAFLILNVGMFLFCSFLIFLLKKFEGILLKEFYKEKKDD